MFQNDGVPDVCLILNQSTYFILSRFQHLQIEFNSNLLHKSKANKVINYFNLRALVLWKNRITCFFNIEIHQNQSLTDLGSKLYIKAKFFSNSQ